jgi:hypothetical protein
MEIDAVTFANGKKAALAACTIGIPAGFATRGDLKKSFTAWLPDREQPKDPEAAPLVIASSLYEPYPKGAMEGITGRSLGKYVQLVAAASENAEKDPDARQQSFSFGSVCGTYNIVRFSGSRNYYPTVYLPGGTQQFHIRVNDPTIPGEQILTFLQQWMETLVPAQTWPESLPLSDPGFTAGELTASSLAAFRANMEQRMHEEAVCFQLGFQVVQEEITRASCTGSPDGETILADLAKVREEYAAALDVVIEESADCIRDVSKNNPDNELLFSLVETIRDLNPLEQVTQTINGEEYKTPVSLAAKKAELFSTPEIRKMEEKRREEEEKAEAVRKKAGREGADTDRGQDRGAQPREGLPERAEGAAGRGACQQEGGVLHGPCGSRGDQQKARGGKRCHLFPHGPEGAAHLPAAQKEEGDGGAARR